jgi:hypothetical protein
MSSIVGSLQPAVCDDNSDCANAKARCFRPCTGRSGHSPPHAGEQRGSANTAAGFCLGRIMTNAGKYPEKYRGYLLLPCQPRKKSTCQARRKRYPYTAHITRSNGRRKLRGTRTERHAHDSKPHTRIQSPRQGSVERVEDAADRHPFWLLGFDVGMQTDCCIEVCEDEHQRCHIQRKNQGIIHAGASV